MMNDSQPVDSWLEQLAAGDPEALARLFDHYRPKLRRMVAVRMAPAVRARLDESDVLQDTFLEARRQLSRYLANPVVPAHVWLRQVTEDRLAKAHRHHLQTQKCAVHREVCLPQNSSLQLIAPFVARTPSPSRQVLRNEFCQRVERIFAGLDPDDREVILLRFFEQVPNQEVAEILGVSASAATMRFGRAMARFHARLQTEFAGESHP